MVYLNSLKQGNHKILKLNSQIRLKMKSVENVNGKMRKSKTIKIKLRKT